MMINIGFECCSKHKLKFRSTKSIDEKITAETEMNKTSKTRVHFLTNTEFKTCNFAFIK